MRAGEEAQAGRGDEVVHAGIELISLEPAAGFVPDLPNDVCIGINGLDAPPEFLPERVVVDLPGDVETPAVDAEFGPILRNAEQELANSRAAGVEFREGGQVPPALITDGLEAAFL